MDQEAEKKGVWSSGPDFLSGLMKKHPQPRGVAAFLRQNLPPFSVEADGYRVLETQRPCSHIQLRDSRLCVYRCRGERGCTSLRNAGHLHPSRCCTCAAGKWPRVLQGLPIAGTGNAASMQLRRLGEACLLSMAPFTRPHTQQHSEAHSVQPRIAGIPGEGTSFPAFPFCRSQSRYSF